jgi:DNA-directed RNA polymerase subunit E'/Rpb7
MNRKNRPDNKGERLKGKEIEKGKVYGVYIDSMLTKKVILSIVEIGKNIKENIHKKLTNQMEGKCIEEGFIRPTSIQIINYSSGVINTENIEFQVVFSCKICHPVEGMIIECQTKTITKAGIHAEVLDGQIIPVTIFVARDHHNMDRYFQSIKENTTIHVKVIGIRYELNDPYICVIGKLTDRSFIEKSRQSTTKPRIQIGGLLQNNDDSGDSANTANTANSTNSDDSGSDDSGSDDGTSVP